MYVGMYIPVHVHCRSSQKRHFRLSRAKNYYDIERLSIAFLHTSFAGAPLWTPDCVVIYYALTITSYIYMRRRVSWSIIHRILNSDRAIFLLNRHASCPVPYKSHPWGGSRNVFLEGAHPSVQLHPPACQTLVDAGGDNGSAKPWNRSGISVTSYHERSQHFHPHPHIP
jgi:hypothetical protein